ncbi:MAG: efflux RND transporter periplasmic adaptor subunit [Fimbriimonadaceae bacterium]
MKPVYLVLLAGLASVGCKKTAAASEDAVGKPLVQVAVAKVARGDIGEFASVNGAVSPLPDHEAKVSPQAPGRIATVLVQTGSYVSKGQTLATLTPGATPGQLQEAEAAVRLARETLTQSRINLTSQIQSQQASVTQTQLALQAQQVALAKLRAGSRPQEIVQATANVAAAQATLVAARQALTRAQTLVGEGLLARKDLEATQQQQKTAAAALVSAQQALSLVRQGNRPEDIRAGEVAVQQAAEAARAAKAQAIQNRSKQQDVQIAKAQLASAEGALHIMQAQARFLSVVSPLSGFVVGRTVNAGENVDVTTVIATVVDLNTVRLLLNVPADKVSQVKVGQRVQFSTDANPTVQHQAVVKIINRIVDPASNTVQIEASAANADRSLRDDGFVKARIVLRVDRGVLTVPTAAVVLKDGKPTVFVVGQDKTVKAHEVELGIQDANRAEIRSGVKFGDQVVTTGAYELDDGMAVSVGS